MTLDLIQSLPLPLTSAIEPSADTQTIRTEDSTVPRHCDTRVLPIEPAIETPLQTRDIVELGSHISSQVLSFLIKESPRNISLEEAARLICNHVAALRNDSSETVATNLSRAYFEKEDDFYKHCLGFIESAQALPDLDNRDSLDSKIERSYRAYKKICGIMKALQTHCLRFVMKDLTFLPPDIERLKNLLKVNLWCNYLTCLPNSIVALENIVTLNINMNNFSHFPIPILSLQTLTSLSMSRNTLTQLPETFGNLINLTNLDLSENKLSELPDSLCQITKLTILTLNENKINRLPTDLGNLYRLTKLTLYRNELQLIPESIDKLSNLQSLDLSFNRLILLPNNMFRLSSLETLLLNNNHLLDFDPRILYISALKNFHLYYHAQKSQLDLTRKIFEKNGFVFIEGFSQPPALISEENHVPYLELPD